MTSLSIKPDSSTQTPGASQTSKPSVNYTPTIWNTGDTITAEKLNHLEQGTKNNGVLSLTYTVVENESNIEKVFYLLSCDVSIGDIQTAYDNGMRITGSVKLSDSISLPLIFKAFVDGGCMFDVVSLMDQEDPETGVVDWGVVHTANEAHLIVLPTHPIIPLVIEDDGDGTGTCVLAMDTQQLAAISYAAAPIMYICVHNDNWLYPCKDNANATIFGGHVLVDGKLCYEILQFDFDEGTGHYNVVELAEIPASESSSGESVH